MHSHAACEPTLNLSKGYLSYNTSRFQIRLIEDAQLLASLVSANAAPFDFCPFDYLKAWAGNLNYHIGDLIFRYRTVGSAAWVEENTAFARKPVTVRSASERSVFASSIIDPTLNASSPFRVIRDWAGLPDGDFTLSFTLTNLHTSGVELGGLGFPVEFDSIFTDRSAFEVQKNCSLTDPNIGLNGGYLRVTRINGQGPAMVITPLNNESASEAWDFLNENGTLCTDSKHQSQTFEGLYQYIVHSLAYAEGEWSSATPWNEPTSKIVQPAEKLTVGLRFKLVDEIDRIEDAVRKTGTPVVTGVPGYVVPQDLEAILYLDAKVPLSSVSSEPSNAFSVERMSGSKLVLRPDLSAFGRVRVTLKYEDGKHQTVHYHISKLGPRAIKDVGDFLNSRHWWKNVSDPFRRATEFMAVDHSDGVGSLIIQDTRVWLAGRTKS